MSDLETNVGIVGFFQNDRFARTETKNTLDGSFVGLIKAARQGKPTKKVDPARSQDEIAPHVNKQEPANGKLSNDSKDFSNVCVSNYVVGPLEGRKSPDKPDKPNEIKGVSDALEDSSGDPSAVCFSDDTKYPVSEKQPDNPDKADDPDETAQLYLPATLPGTQIIPTIKGASGCDVDISFPCPVFERRCRSAHALSGHGLEHWSFACDFGRCPGDISRALAELNPAFAELLQRYAPLPEGELWRDGCDHVITMPGNNPPAAYCDDGDHPEEQILTRWRLSCSREPGDEDPGEMPTAADNEPGDKEVPF